MKSVRKGRVVRFESHVDLPSSGIKRRYWCAIPVPDGMTVKRAREVLWDECLSIDFHFDRKTRTWHGIALLDSTNKVIVHGRPCKRFGNAMRSLDIAVLRKAVAA